MEHIFESGAASLIGSIIAGLITINIAFFRWLLARFESLSNKIETYSALYTNQLDIAEAKYQARHEENLRRFEKISVALAKLGSDNGT